MLTKLLEPTSKTTSDKRFTKPIEYKEWSRLTTPKAELATSGVCISWESLNNAKFLEDGFTKTEVSNFTEHKSLLAILWALRLSLNDKFQVIDTTKRDEYRTNHNYIKLSVKDASKYLKASFGDGITRANPTCIVSTKSEVANPFNLSI